jgi:hypothetical protein
MVLGFVLSTVRNRICPLRECEYYPLSPLSEPIRYHWKPGQGVASDFHREASASRSVHEGGRLFGRNQIVEGIRGGPEVLVSCEFFIGGRKVYLTK